VSTWCWIGHVSEVEESVSKILITTSSFNVAAAEALGRLQREGFRIVTNPHARKLSEDEAAGLLADEQVLGLIAGTEPLTRKVLSGARGLRVISRCGIGMDSVDTVAARDSNIAVYNTPDAPSIAVAELTVGLILNVLRKISQADRALRDGQWKPLMGGLLGQRTVGIIGYGRIGRRVAKLVRGFGARVLATDAVSLDLDGIAEVCTLEQLLTESDVLTLHMPAQPGSGHFIDARRIRLMKRGAILVNTARGGLVDEVALYAALREGVLAGAAFDTFESEPYGGPLKTLSQVVLTAHMGSYAEESRSIMEREAADNLLKGLTAAGLVEARG